MHAWRHVGHFLNISAKPGQIWQIPWRHAWERNIVHLFISWVVRMRNSAGIWGVYYERFCIQNKHLCVHNRYFYILNKHFYNHNKYFFTYNEHFYIHICLMLYIIFKFSFHMSYFHSICHIFIRATRKPNILSSFILGFYLHFLVQHLNSLIFLSFSVWTINVNMVSLAIEFAGIAKMVTLMIKNYYYAPCQRVLVIMLLYLVWSLAFLFTSDTFLLPWH